MHPRINCLAIHPELSLNALIQLGLRCVASLVPGMPECLLDVWTSVFRLRGFTMLLTVWLVLVVLSAAIVCMGGLVFLQNRRRKTTKSAELTCSLRENLGMDAGRKSH